MCEASLHVPIGTLFSYSKQTRCAGLCFGKSIKEDNIDVFYPFENYTVLRAQDVGDHNWSFGRTCELVAVGARYMSDKRILELDERLWARLGD